MKNNYAQIFLLAFLLSGILIPSRLTALSDSLITTSTSWKYLDNGSNQGTGWKATSFNDASWATGAAELGYGDADEATVTSFGSSTNNKSITTYFRKTFTVTNASDYSSLTFGIVRDDGAIVYLNGTEVFRTNMPSGSVNFKTKASTDITGPGESAFIYYSVASNLLVSGTNNVSVEIHQYDKASPDISFKLNLAALRASCFSPIGLSASAITANTATLSWAAVSGAAGYNVQYRVIGNPVWSSVSSTTNSVGISSLVPASNYQWQVQTSCGSANLSSYSVLSGFSTASLPCTTPPGINTTNITAVSATLNWTAVSGAVGYTVRYRVTGSTSWSTTTSGTNSLNLSSLNPTTGYEWGVQADCGSGNLSAFSPATVFSTDASSCTMPTGLTVYSITSSSAVVSWNSVSGAVSYNSRYRINGSPTWTTISSTAAILDIPGLMPASPYEFQVQTVCSTSTGSFTTSLIFTTQSSSAFDTLISNGTSWKYNDKGTNLGTTWRNTGYNDSSWVIRPAELGYGDGDEATVVSYGPDPNNKYTTTYFRKSFTVNNPAGYVSLMLNIVRDDGAVVYLNGTEVYRSNMPTGTVAYSTFATAAIGGTDESAWYSSGVNASLLVSGTNVLAVEIHQSNLTSTDISFNFRLLATRVRTIVQGPYLQTITPTSVIVRWLTNTASASRVRYGLSTSGYSIQVYDPALVTDHSIRISGLLPATKYYYTIEDQSYVLQGDSNNFFYTAPVTGSTAPVRIWAIGDFGNASAGQAAVRDAYTNYAGTAPTNLWLWLGDNAYSLGTEAEYQDKVFNVYPQQFKNMPLYPSPGNHDYAQSGYQSSASLTTNFPYFRIVSVPTAGEAGGVASMTEKYYSYNYSNIHFISLDSYGSLNSVGSPMYNWLVNDLDANQQRWTIVYFHHPPYTKGSHNSDSDAELANMRTRILPVLESHNVDLVLSGHSHVNERTPLIKGHFGLSASFNASMIIQGGSGTGATPYIKSPPYYGTVYAVCGTGGQLSTAVQTGWPMPCMYFSNNTQNASLVIDVNGDQLDCKFLSGTERIIDEFTIVKTGSARIAAERVANKFSFRAEPNPFKNETHISYILPEDASVALDIYNMLGEKVWSFINQRKLQQKGSYEYIFSPLDRGLSPGIYSVRLLAGDHILVQKIVFAE